MISRILALAIAVVTALGGPARALDCGGAAEHARMFLKRIPGIHGEVLDSALMPAMLKRLAAGTGRTRIFADVIWVWKLPNGMVWVIPYYADRACTIYGTTKEEYAKLMVAIAGRPI